MKNNVYDFRPGEILSMMVTTGLENEMMAENPKKYNHVVGGKRVASNVKLNLNNEDSSQSITLTWSSAEETPWFYEITLHKVHDDTFKKAFTAKAAEAKLSIDQLDPETKYYCVIIARYAREKTGKEVKSNTVKTDGAHHSTAVAPEHCMKVVVEKSEQNPCRQVIVKWDRPKEESKVDYYKVYLVYESKKHTPVMKLDRNAAMAIFKDLKSNTTYTAFVTTVKKGFMKSSKPTKSVNTVETDMAPRLKDFDISSKGKPLIISSTAVPVKIGYDAMLKWKLPDLGVESNNYKYIKAECMMADENGKPLGLLKEKDENTFVSPKPLQSGKLHRMKVTVTYKDLDEESQVAACEFKEVETEMKEPNIQSIDWKSQQVILTWKKAEGASEHILKILNESHVPIKELSLKATTKASEKCFIKMEKFIQYGDTCKFIIEALNQSEKVKTHEKQVLIGGSGVVTNVKMEIASKRELYVSWEPPKATPERYALQLYQRKDDIDYKNVGEPQQVGVQERLFKWEKLKCDTNYFCSVAPIYKSNLGNETFSSWITTPKRQKERAHEKDLEFGKTRISTTIIPKQEKNVTMLVSWTAVHPGDDYQVTKYIPQIRDKSSFHHWLDDVKTLTALDFGTTQVEIPNLSPGKNYTIEIITVLMDLDTHEKFERTSKEPLMTDLGSTKLQNHCDWNDETVTFYWTAVSGAAKYELLFQDENQHSECNKNQFPSDSQTNDLVSGTVEMTESLRTGQMCTAKVISHADNGLTSASEWKNILIGNDWSPRNVKAIINSSNPVRSIILSFDQPLQENPDHFEVLAIPSLGRMKNFKTKSTPYTIENLKSGTGYKFKVRANWGCESNKFNRFSISNGVRTQEKTSGNSPMNISGNKNLKMDISNTTFALSTISDDLKREDFGMIRSVNRSLKEERNHDILEVRWDPPSFGNKNFDYKVEQYILEIQKENDKPRTELCPFDSDTNQYQHQTELELGKKYKVSIKTSYEDIDRDVIQLSSAVAIEVYSRPCKPKIISNKASLDSLQLKWNAVNGALKFKVELRVDGSSKPSIEDDVGIETTFKYPFDAILGYGKSYEATVIAVGENGCNSQTTEKTLIGGDYVPTKVKATIKSELVTDPSTQVYISWSAPVEPPKAYHMEVCSQYYESLKKIDLEKTEPNYLVEGLKAGTTYYFKVIAEYGDVDRFTGGCFSNQIKTSPLPTRVKNVWTKPGTDPTTTIEIYWEEVDAEKKDEVTKYRVKLRSEGATLKKEVNVEGVTKVMINGLRTGTKYFATVSAGNTEGYGEKSSEVSFVTGLALPKDVRLLNNTENPMTSLSLEFSPADETPDTYVCQLYEYLDQNKHRVGDAVEITQCSYVFRNLQCNSKYMSEVWSVFNSEKSDVVSSEKILTAPSPVKITDCGIIEIENRGSQQVFAEWVSDKGVMLHEVKIMKEPGGCEENTLIIYGKSKMKYSCQQESALYSIKIRPRNEAGLYGKWSGTRNISLAPAKLEKIKTFLNKDDGRITIQCLPASRHSPIYLMKAFCNGNAVTMLPQTPNRQNQNAVEWVYNPLIPAEIYEFQIWAQSDDGKAGEVCMTEKVMSRPGKVEIEKAERCSENSTMDISVSWKPLDRCDLYHVKLWIEDENPECTLTTAKTSMIYRCHEPGNTYFVSIAGSRNFVMGTSSDHLAVDLLPMKVQLKQDDNNQPVDSIELMWEPLKVPLEGYKVMLMSDSNLEKEEIVGLQSTGFSFTKALLQQGKHYYCKIIAFNKAGDGEAAITKIYQITPKNPENISVMLHEDDPFHKATLTWDEPDGIDCYELHIECNQNGILTKIKLTENYYVFQSGIPGNSYQVRLHSGYNGRVRNTSVKAAFSLKPMPPHDIKVSVVYGKSLFVEFVDPPSSRKIYEITIKRVLYQSEEVKVIRTTENHVYVENLPSGASYEVSVLTEINGGMRSPNAQCHYVVQTLPGMIKNLRSEEVDQRVIFKWDDLEISPKYYLIQWRVNNENIREATSRDSKFSIDDVCPACWYHIRVTAVNTSGKGEMTEWISHNTKPAPPRNLQVFKDPSLSTIHLAVKFDDERHHLKKYEVKLVSVDERDPHIVSDTISEQNAVFKNLRPGTEYRVSVSTWFCGKQSEEVEA